MEFNPHYKKFKNKSDSELFDRLNNPKSYTVEAILAAFQVLKERSIELSEVQMELEKELLKKVSSEKLKLMTPKVEIHIIKILNASFQIWKQNFKTIALTIAIVFIPVQIFIELISMIFEAFFGPNNFENLESIRSMSDQFRAYDLIRQLIGAIATLGIFNFTYRIIRENNSKLDYKELIKLGLKLWPRNFILSLYAGLIVLLYTFLLILPGIYKAVRFAFVSSIVADHEEENCEPLDRSEYLTQDYWWDIFGMLLLTFLIGLVIEVVLVVPFLYLPENIIVTIVSGVSIAIGSSITIVFKAHFYDTLRNIKSESISE